MIKEYIYIVVAAGQGTRMNFSYPKQFHKIKDKPIYIKTLETIDGVDIVNKIIVVTNKDKIKEVSEEINKYGITKVKNVVAGGHDRQQSVKNGLDTIKERDVIVGIQDGVRPNIQESQIKEAYNILTKENDIDGVVVAVKAKDTVKIIKDGFIVESPNRDSVYLAQTPQVFTIKKIKEAYDTAEKNNTKATDDASLVELIGGKVKIIEGSYGNIKITTIEDLKLIEK